MPVEKKVEKAGGFAYSYGSFPYGGRRIMNKNSILNQIKLNRTSTLLAESQEVDYFRRIIEDVGARNYPRLAAIGNEYGITLAPLFRALEKKAVEIFRQEIMPKSCEIALLQLMLSSKADERRLINLAPQQELPEQTVVDLYFLLFSAQFSDSDIDQFNGMIDEYGLKKLRDFIFDNGLQRWFNIRYKMVKVAPEEDISINQVIEQISLPVIFDESLVVRRYVTLRLEKDTRARDMKEDLYIENSLRVEAGEKLRRLYEMFDFYPCDFVRLKEILIDLNMHEELCRIELEGINHLKDYVRNRSVIGAQEVALRYDFVAPATSGVDLSAARKAVSASFLSQALKNKKGKVFLRAEALYNLNSSLRSGQCFHLPNGYLLAILHTADQVDHYLFGRYGSGVEQSSFALGAIAAFLCQETGQKAVRSIVLGYMESLAGEIRVNNAIKKTIYALPLILGLAVMVALVYYFTIGGIAGSLALGSGLAAIGVAIAAKNGYDEEVTPSSHERIPEYLSRQQGKVVMTSINTETLTQAEMKAD